MNKLIRIIIGLSLKKKILSGFIILTVFLFWISQPAHLFNTPTSFVVEDKDNRLLSASIATDGQWRFPYNQKVPSKFEQCISSFEDKRFRYHPGVDLLAFSRAMWQNIRQRKVVSGGSTLTMQVVRMYRKDTKRSIWNKLIECIMAVRLECTYRKSSILALYASNAPFGSNVVGLDAAAWRYYGRSASELTWGEMAALAVLPNAPSLVHPGKNTATLLRKRNELIDKLVKEHIIDEVTGGLSKAEKLPGEPKALPQIAPHLLSRIKKEYTNWHKEYSDLPTLFHTTIDADLQQQVNNIVLQHHQQLKGNQINNAAAMVVEIETGNVLSYIGNVYQPQDSTIESYVDVLSSSRSPGSTLKPLIYASLLTDGSMLPKQIIPDIPTQFGCFMPENFDLGYDGAVPANKALSRSLNIPAVRMLQQYKYQRFYDKLKQAGITTLNKPAENYGLSLILGGCEISPFELAGVYSSMARMYNHQQNNKGKWNANDWHMPEYVVSKKDLQKKSNITSSLFDYTALWHTFNAMNEVMRPGEEGLWGMFSSAEHIAWKTGTSFGFRDGWAVGFTPKHLVLVWIGNTTGEGRPDLTGINTAAPIMFDIFRLLPNADWFHSPTSGFSYIPVCKKSGYKLGMDCSDTELVMVGERANQSVICPYCRKINVDNPGIFRVNEACESPSRMVQQSWFVLPPTIEYYFKQKHPEYKTLPPFKSGCVSDASKMLEMIYPEESAIIYIPVELTGEKGKVVFKATHRNKNAKVYWHLDEDYITTTTQFHQAALNPVPGKHTITIVDQEGNSVSRHFDIQLKD